MCNSIFNLTDKEIFITGASSGIGRATAILCSRFGAHVIITGRDTSRLNETFSQLEGTGHRFFTTDLTENFDILLDNIHILDGIVHCAGIINLIPFSYLTEEELIRTFKINFYSPVFLTQYLVKRKRIQRNSSIVFISSLSGNLIASPGNCAYGASKSALNGVMKGMALELAPKRIRVNCIMPGMVKTEMISSFLSSLNEEQLIDDEKQYPLGYGEASDVANAAVFLLSEASKWITGTSLVLDGGFSIK